MDVDRKCIQAALAGNVTAMRKLVLLLTPVVQARVARALLRRGNLGAHDLRQDVADFTQEAFAALFADGGRALTSWDPAAGRSLSNYVGQRVEWFVASLLRGVPIEARPRSREQGMVEQAQIEPGARGSVRSADSIESRDSVRRVVAGIERRWPELGVRLFYLLFVLQTSSKEVGDELGLSCAAVDQWRFRLREFARGLLLEE
jgi:RNA polymerase sigma-70 factor (ECF subfamily)